MHRGQALGRAVSGHHAAQAVQSALLLAGRQGVLRARRLDHCAAVRDAGDVQVLGPLLLQPRFTV